MDKAIFKQRESEVRGYCRTFKTVFEKAVGATLTDEDGREYVDFFAGAGTLNYGHNHPKLKQALLDYLMSDGVIHSLDMFTVAKRHFLETFEKVILEPRELDYKVMFPGPTGTNAVEAALKLARKVTGRTQVIAFTNGFHGMTLGSLALTGNASKRKGAGVPLSHVTHMPFDGFYGEGVNTLKMIEKHLEGNSTGLEKPAAFVVETVQGEGGINVASETWLRGLSKLAKKHGALLIIDDIQAGCGRTGHFFSFERAGIQPDIVTLSKSLSGFGLPFSLALFKSHLDIWEPGEHNGTFRGHNPAFITATKALSFWEDDQLANRVKSNERYIADRLDKILSQYPEHQFQARGLGMMWGIDFKDGELGNKMSADCFQQGLILEAAGPEDNVLKLLPPLTIERELLAKGLDIIEKCLASAMAESTSELEAMAS